LAGAKAGNVFIDMSTVDPESSSRVAKPLEAKGVKMLRAPVSGSPLMASSGALTILVSGDNTALDRCQPIFAAMGKKIFHVGTGEEARYLKLVLNIMLGTTCQMLAEALTFGKKAGLDWKQMFDIISNSVVGSPFVNSKADAIKDRIFKPVFTASYLAKDFDLAYSRVVNSSVVFAIAFSPYWQICFCKKLNRLMFQTAFWQDQVKHCAPLEMAMLVLQYSKTNRAWTPVCVR
jgi:3-hydroxyisobutyrate dehydrogenase-like beta-hydroxyacid dehydrogenase